MGRPNWSRAAAFQSGFDHSTGKVYGGRCYYESISTAGSEAHYDGHTDFGATAAAAFDLAQPPVAGLYKSVYNKGGSTTVQKLDASTDGTIDFISTAGRFRSAHFNGPKALYLVSASSTLWRVLSNNGGVTFSSSA